MEWRLANSLSTCRAQANAHAPNRSKASDGTIGNVSHASGPSGHNPDSNGVVTSFDLTYDPANGMDCHKWIRLLVAKPELIPDDLHYAISNKRIFNRDYNWLDRPYSGADPHTNHVHLSVGRGPDPVVDGGPVGQPYDNSPNWHFDLLDTGEDDMSYETSDRARDDTAAYAISLILPAVGRIEQKLATTPEGVDYDKIVQTIKDNLPLIQNDQIKQALKDAIKEGTG